MSMKCLKINRHDKTGIRSFKRKKLIKPLLFIFVGTGSIVDTLTNVGKASICNHTKKVKDKKRAKGGSHYCCVS
jgi:hypothetical protein